MLSKAVLPHARLLLSGLAARKRAAFFVSRLGFNSPPALNCDAYGFSRNYYHSVRVYSRSLGDMESDAATRAKGGCDSQADCEGVAASLRIDRRLASSLQMR